MDPTFEEIIIVNPSVDLEALEQVCLDLELDLLETFEPPAAPFYEQVLETEDGEILAHIIHDHFVEIWLFTLETRDEKRVLDMQRKILDRIDGFTRSDLLAVLDRSEGVERKFALRGVVAANNGAFDAALFDRVVAALQDDDADLRYTAVICAARLSWSRFVDVLKELVGKESDTEVKERAQSTLEVIEAVHGSQR